MFDVFITFSKFIGLAVSMALSHLSRAITSTFHRYTYKAVDAPRNVIVIGASFAGYHASKLLANSLPTGYRVVVIEKNSHFQFSWCYPRFSVVPGNETKSFIPYGGYLKGSPKGSCEFVQDSVIEIERSAVRLRSGASFHYEYLVLTTGAQAGPPSRLGVEERAAGVGVLQEQQRRIKESSNIVIVGGGPAGVELATDAKAYYPEKNITLIHSRKQLLHAFGPKLHEEAMKALKELNVQVVLSERLRSDAEEDGVICLSDGRSIDCDLLVKCVGQQPGSGILANLSPTSISSTGKILVKDTLQILDSEQPNIYAAGDVASTDGPGNSRSAMLQAETVADNIINSIRGKPMKEYHTQWWERGIELTLGLKKTVLYFQDGKRETAIHSKGTDMVKKCGHAWKHLGAKPFKDSEVSTSVKEDVAV